MKLKKFINTLPARQVVTICNRDEEILIDGRIDDIEIMADALGDKQILSNYSDTNCLDEDYLTIILDTSINQKDIFRALSYYFNTLSYGDIASIVRDKVGIKVREE